MANLSAFAGGVSGTTLLRFSTIGVRQENGGMMTSPNFGGGVFKPRAAVSLRLGGVQKTRPGGLDGCGIEPGGVPVAINEG